MFLKPRQSISSVSGSIRLWKITPWYSIARSEFSTGATFNSGKQFLKRLYDSQFEADGTPVARRKPKNPNPSSIKKGLADQLRLQGYVAEDGLPPLTLLHQAEKSGALNIGANDALGIVRRYIQIAGTKEGLWEADFCTGECLNKDPYPSRVISYHCPRGKDTGLNLEVSLPCPNKMH